MTAETEECIHGLTPETCSICLYGISKPVALSVVAQFRARYDGECNGCDLQIIAGQMVVKLSDDSYRHGRCFP